MPISKVIRRKMAQDSWRCSCCDKLIYNITMVDGIVYAAPGAPDSRFISKEYPMVCTLCFELYEIEQQGKR